MSKVSKQPAGRRPAAPRPDDPRVVRTQAAVVAAARTLFLRQGYAGTTMAEIAALAGLTKRTVYNNYADKDALFTQIVGEVMAYAETFARGLREELGAGHRRRRASAPRSTISAGGWRSASSVPR